MSHRKTLSDLRTAVRDNLDEATASFWTDAKLNRTITRAADAVWTEVRKLKGEDYFQVTRDSTAGTTTILGETYSLASFQIVAGTTQSVTLPPDFSEMKLVETITSGYEYVRWDFLDLADPDFRALRRITEQITPGSFVFDITDERTMVYAPRTNTTLDLRLTYTQIMPALSTDADELEMPHPLYLAVEELATARAQMMDRDPNAKAWFEWARNSVANALGSSTRQLQDPVFVREYLR